MSLERGRILIQQTKKFSKFSPHKNIIKLEEIQGYGNWPTYYTKLRSMYSFKKEKESWAFYNNNEGLWYSLLKLLPSLTSAKSAWWYYKCRAMHKTSSFVSRRDASIWTRTQPVASSNKNHDKWHMNWEANEFKWQWIGKIRGSVSLRLQF